MGATPSFPTTPRVQGKFLFEGSTSLYANDVVLEDIKIGAASYPVGIANGALLFHDFTNLRLKKFDLTSKVASTLLGTGTAGMGEGEIYEATLKGSKGGVYDSATNTLYFADTTGNVIRSLNLTTGFSSIIAGLTAGTAGMANGTGQSASFSAPTWMIKVGNFLVVCDSGNHAIRTINLLDLQVKTLAGTGAAGASDVLGSAAFNNPTSIAWNAATNELVIADTTNHKIRGITVTYDSYTMVATGIRSVTGGANTASTAGYVDGAIASAAFSSPSGVFVYNNDFYVTDQGNNRLRKINTGNTVSTILGNGTAGAIDGKFNDTNVQLNAPYCVYFDSENNLAYIGESARIRVIDMVAQTIMNVVGNGTGGHTINDVMKPIFTAGANGAKLFGLYLKSYQAATVGNEIRVVVKDPAQPSDLNQALVKSIVFATQAAGVYYENMSYFVNVQGQTLTGLVVNQNDGLLVPPNAQVCVYPTATLAAPMACTITAVDF